MNVTSRSLIFSPAIAFATCAAFCLVATPGLRGRAEENGGLDPTQAATDLTYAKHIAPIIQNKCQTCHRPGTAAPFSLSNYDDVVAWSETIKEVVEQKRMPPWH